MALRKLIRPLLDSRRVRALWQSNSGWFIIGLLPRHFRECLKTFYRRVLVVPVFLPSVLSSSDPWGHSRPLLSVIIPCYNYGRYIHETLQSLRSQTFRDFEIIVVDDGSDEDLTLKILDNLRNSGIQVLREEKSNVASALNLGIRSARGRYVCCLAADDTVEPTYFEKSLCLLESNPGVAIAYSLVKTFGDEDAIWFTEAFDLRLLLEYNYVCAAAVFRKAIWEVVNGFDQSMNGYEDWDFWIKVGKAGFRGKLIPETLFNYRRHGTTLNLRSDRDYQNLIGHIRANHKDLYAHLDQIREIQTNYRDIKVPEPFINLTSKAQYLKSGQPEVVLLVSASDNQDVELSLQDVATKLVGKQAVDFVLIKTSQIVYERKIPRDRRPNHNYCLEQFLDPYCWLDFVLNVIRTRSVKSVVISNSALTYEWMAALKNRASCFVMNVIQDDKFLDRSAKCDEFIDLHIVFSEHSLNSLTRDLGVPPRKIRSLSTSQQTNVANDL